jgi:hypothetical protein
MRNQARLNQARHNEKTARLLHDQQVSDWTITVAFYASIHYARYLLFPLEHEGFTYQTFDQFANGEQRGKHEILLNLLRKHHPEIWGPHKWLKDAATKARYDNYQANPIQAQTALLKLDIVRNYVERKVG